MKEVNTCHNKNFNMIYPYKNAWEYIEEIQQSENADHQALWNQYLIEPYWDKISEWAPASCDFMKPKPIKNIEALKQQLLILDTIDFERIQQEFIKISQALPIYDDDPITVAIYPIDDDDSIVKERQNGVVGACVFGNIIMHVNPFAQDYIEWIPYVFAHEYHHAVWGHNWHVLKGGLKGSLLEHLINEGEADTFAKHMYPHLNPSWVSNVSKEEQRKAWAKIKPVLDSTDRNVHAQYVFGSEALDLPWCIGYYFGYTFINSFLDHNPEISLNDLLDMHPNDIFTRSGWANK